MSSNRPKVRVNDVQEVEKEKSFPNDKAYEALCLLGQLILFLFKLMYYCGESLYYKFKPPPPVSVKGEIVLITGTGHGIGKELALAYSAAGATVVGWDVNKKNCDETVREIARLGGRPKAYSFQCDITNREDVLKLAKQIQSTIGDVGILINNAGIMPCHLLREHTPQEIEKTISVNLVSHFWMLEAFLPSMKRNNQGHIVTLSSMAGLVGFPNLIPYCASKFAVRGYMEALQDELFFENPNNNIKLTIIYPYMVDTGLCKKPKIKYEKLMPLLSPKEVAQKIMEAQTNGLLESTVPSYLLGVNKWARLMPLKAALNLKKMFDTYVESDL